MKNQILFHEQPVISSFPSIALSMMVLQSNFKRTRSWIFSKYIQLISFDTYYQENWPRHIINFMEAETAKGNVLADCELLKVYQVPRFFADNAYIDFVSFVRGCISRGYYLQMNLNHKYFPFSPFYQKQDHMHPTVLYGTDDEQIYLSDFFDWQYRFKSVSPADLQKARFTTDQESDLTNQDYYYDIDLVRLRDAEYAFNMKLVQTALMDYLDAKDSTKKYFGSPRMQRSVIHYGVACYDILARVLFYKREIDIRPFHVLSDHKKLMQMRVEYLIEGSYVNPEHTERLRQSIEELLGCTLALERYMFKLQIGKRPLDIEAVTASIQRLKEQDIAFTQLLLECLK